ncbi:MAG: alpha/beta hydrolase [Gemmatimonadaceae bacterium]|nr:alpha/beta hydrolase [Gemmatimonadaceae bacterium]
MSERRRDHGATSPSWQSRVVHLLVSARMRPYVHRPIDPEWVRRQMGRPRAPRRWMAQATGALSRVVPADGRWPGGEYVAARQLTEGAPVLLYLHGGGYIACSPETHRSLVGSLVQRIGGSAYVPAYRLAPEHPFPAALNDACAAYDSLVLDRGVVPSRIVIAGDSAGGGLALALALAIRDSGRPQPAAVMTFSPWTDMAATGDSLDENTDRCAMFAGDTIRRASALYVGASDPMHPHLSPLYGDFAGMPPLLLHASEDEVLRDDAIRVAERARAAGVDVELRLWKQVPHVWQFFAAVLPEADQSLRDAVRFITKHTHS